MSNNLKVFDICIYAKHMLLVLKKTFFSPSEKMSNKQIRELMTSYIKEHEHLLAIVKHRQLTWFGLVIR